MKKTVLCLSGWAQKHDSLKNLFSKNDFEVINFDYSKFANVADFFEAIAKQKINPDLIIGWSLGGQLACRLIAGKILFPKYLVLLAAPFQFVKSSRIAAAMPQKAFDEFRHNFASKPDKTLKRFSLLMNINDKNAQELINNLDVNDENHEQLVGWLDELERFSCFDLDFTNFPKTLIFHGSADQVVHSSQSRLFNDKIANSSLEIIAGCGHVIHASHQDYLAAKIS